MPISAEIENRTRKRIIYAIPTNYLYDGDNLIEGVNGSGVENSSFTQGLSIDEPLGQLRDGTTSYYGSDGLGSVTSLFSTSGSLANNYSYDSIGTLVASSGTILNPFQYTAREFDSETGLNFYRARYYDHNSERFISEDPMGFDGDGPDFYAYVGNDPVDATDPWGLKLCKTRLPGLGDAYMDDQLYPLVQMWIQLNEMNGVDPIFTESFRTTEYQTGLQSNSNAITPAPPGTSLHEAGFAVDISWRRLSPTQQAQVVRNARIAGLDWGGNFKKPDKVHFFHDPSNRRSRIADAQRQFKNGVSKCDEQCSK